MTKFLERFVSVPLSTVLDLLSAFSTGYPQDNAWQFGEKLLTTQNPGRRSED